VRPLTEGDILRIVAEFAAAARRAQRAGFDGVQLHAAHGYLIHQFLSPYTNTRKDDWAEGPRLLIEIVRAVKNNCGNDFPVFAKFSCADDRGLTLADTLGHIRAVESGLDAAEISYGTMEYGLNIIRGAWPVERAFEVNPLLQSVPRPLRGLFSRLVLSPIMKRRLPFEENYNLLAASQIAKQVRLPIIAVGGFRRAASLRSALTDHRLAAVSLCRPFLCEPGLARAIRSDANWARACTNCTLCTVNCDAPHPVTCVRQQKKAKHEHVPL
jgi:2,4-dienoyl-CoA reductase-like NADH-dependent reductase (Old Yellow Enzyme family)